MKDKGWGEEAGGRKGREITLLLEDDLEAEKKKIRKMNLHTFSEHLRPWGVP